MPRFTEAAYAAHVDNLLKLARKKGEVSQSEVAKELNVSRPVAGTIIKRAGLTETEKKGRTQFYGIDGDESETPQEPVSVKQSKTALPPEVKAAAVPVSADTGDDDDVDAELADIDAQIADTRNAMRAAAEKAGKALSDWATHQALVDALRERMTELASRKMKLSL